MSTHSIHYIQKIENYIHLPPNPALELTLNGSNYPCLEQIYKVLKMLESLRLDCI